MNAAHRPLARRASDFAARRCGVALALFMATAVTLRAQEAPSATPALPTISGRVVRESDGTPVVGANVEAWPASQNRDGTTTDDRGEFLRVGKPGFEYATATRREPFDFVSYLTISAPGVARTLVDPCSDAPWAAPIRVRGTATIRGRVENAPKNQVNHVVVIANAKDLCWPPRTGLTETDPRWLGDLDAEGRFEIPDVPAEVPLFFCWNAGTSGSHGVALADDPVLAAGEEREWNSRAPEGAVPLRTTRTPHPAEDPWIPVDPTAHDSEARTPTLLARDLVDVWRFLRHRNGGGRYHVHGWRACHHLEAMPEMRTLVAFDASGQIGLERFEVRADDSRVLPRATVAPGALLRIAFDGPEERARIALSSRGIEFAARELPRGVVWYELVPAGDVSVRVVAPDSEARTSTVETKAGTIVPLAL